VRTAGNPQATLRHLVIDHSEVIAAS